MRYIDLFSGYGGFSLGIEKAFEKQNPGTKPLCVGFSEIDKYAIEIYQKHFPERKNYGDITKIDPEELPDFDLLVGGFPCQSFSVAGKRGGFGDTRGTLFFDVCRIVAKKRPRLVLLENVKGLLSHDEGRTFRTIVGSIDELGYDVQWQVLNSKDFGVPQNRERVFIVGHLRGTPRPEVFPFRENDEIFDGTRETKPGQAQAEVCGTLKANAAIRADDTFIKETGRLSDALRVRGIDGHSVTLKGLGGGMGAKTGLYAVPVLTPDRKEKRQNGRRMKENGDPMFTLTGQDKHGVFNGKRIRRLTPLECERLMGLPDGWTEGVSDTQRYKLCGNGVVVNVVEAIIERLKNNS